MTIKEFLDEATERAIPRLNGDSRSDFRRCRSNAWNIIPNVLLEVLEEQGLRKLADDLHYKLDVVNHDNAKWCLIARMKADHPAYKIVTAFSVDANPPIMAKIHATFKAEGKKRVFARLVADEVTEDTDVARLVQRFIDADLNTRLTALAKRLEEPMKTMEMLAKIGISRTDVKRLYRAVSIFEKTRVPYTADGRITQYFPIGDEPLGDYLEQSGKWLMDYTSTLPESIAPDVAGLSESLTVLPRSIANLNAKTGFLYVATERFEQDDWNELTGDIPEYKPSVIYTGDLIPRSIWDARISRLYDKGKLNRYLPSKCPDMDCGMFTHLDTFCAVLKGEFKTHNEYRKLMYPGTVLVSMDIVEKISLT